MAILIGLDMGNKKHLSVKITLHAKITSPPCLIYKLEFIFEAFKLKHCSKGDCVSS